MWVIRTKKTFEGKHYYFFNEFCPIQEVKLALTFDCEESAKDYFEEIKKANKGLSFDTELFGVFKL